MSIKQVSVIIENVPGMFLAASECLGREAINIRAISVADTSGISTVRFVADNPTKALSVLKANGYRVLENEVLAVEIPDHPGAMQAILKPLREASINVLYFYTFLGRGESGQPIVIIGVDKTAEAAEALKKNWVQTFGQEIYSL